MVILQWEGGGTLSMSMIKSDMEVDKKVKCERVQCVARWTQTRGGARLRRMPSV